MIETAERADAAHLRAIAGLLRRNALPTAGLDDSRVVALVARNDQKIIGSAALELYDDAALLRSVAVDAAARGQGLGQRLTYAALELARERGIRRVYLLTETADDFFGRFGFRLIDRADVDAAVRESLEFTHACPAGARVMLLQLA